MILFNRDSSSRWHYVIALFLGVAIAATLVAVIAPIAYLYRHPDGSHYLEAARNFLAGRGLMVTAGLDKFPLATAPLSLEPPGYPIIIAFISKVFGADPTWLAPRIDWVSWALLPCALLFTLRPALKNWSIHIISILVMIAPGVIENAWQPLTDVPFLLLTIGSFGLLFRGSWPKTNPGLLLLSGLIGGLAYSLRNVGATLFVSVMVTYLTLVLLRLLRPNIAIHQILWWGIGAILILIPLEIRNLSVFGTVQPYQMAPSELALTANIRYFILELLTDLTGQRALAVRLLWNNALFIAIGITVLILLAIGRKLLVRFWAQSQGISKEMLIAFVANFLAGSMIVILARSRYHWNEVINQREILQYDWLLLAVFALFLKSMQPIPRFFSALLSAAIVIFSGIRINYAWQEIEMDRQTYAVAMNPSALAKSPRVIPYSSELAMKLAIARDRNLIQAIDKLPADTILLSNYDDVIRVETGRVAHNIHPEDDCRAIVQIPDMRSSTKVVTLIFPFGTIVRSGCWERLKRSPRMDLSVTRPYLISLGKP